MSRYKGYSLLYVNGGSHTAGGGLEDLSIYSDSVVTFYKEKYNVYWDKMKSCSFASHLSELIDIPLINEAENGGSSQRVVRMTYQFLESFWGVKNRIFIILELPEHVFQTEVYYNSEKAYYMLHYGYGDTPPEAPNYVHKAAPKVDKIDSRIESQKYIFQEYLERHHNFREHGKATERAIVGLYSFCKFNNIAIKLMNKVGTDYLDTMVYKNIFLEQDIINFSYADGLYSNCNIWEWCKENKKCIHHEIPEHSDSMQPGYFGQKEYAEHLKNWLDNNLEAAK